MSKQPPPPGLTLRTLSGTYESSRAVTRLTTIETCATYQQLSRRLAIIARNPDLLKEFYNALESLSQHSHRLGMTALIHPADHPLVPRE